MAIYHFHAAKGQKGKHSARAKSEYITREGKYQQDAAEVLAKGSGNMPEWAQNVRAYWQAADENERANGRLFRQYELSLPRELTLEQQHELAVELIQEVTNAPEGRLPYSYAIHKGEGHNPHLHLMVSERVNDGIERTPETWFKRASKAEPEKGGAIKAESLERKERLIELRASWAGMANAALERAGQDARIDHRSLLDQGIDREPMPHIGPAALQMEERGIATKKGQKALEATERNEKRSRQAERSPERAGDSGAGRTVSTEHSGPGGRFEARNSSEAGRTQPDGYSRSEGHSGASGGRPGLETAIAGGRERGEGSSGRPATGKSHRGAEDLPDGRVRVDFSRDSSLDRILFLGNGVQRKGQSAAKGGEHMVLHREKHGELATGRGERHSEAAALGGSSGTEDRTSTTADRTTEAVRNQIRAMGCKSFEIGVREQETGKMMNREMTAEKLLEAVPWLKRMNAQGNDIYIRPGRTEARALVLVDDIDGTTIDAMKERGVSPACVVQTSYKNLQAWVSVGVKPMTDAEKTEVAKILAKEFGADPASADGRHYGRLGGFTNRKPEHLRDGGYPYVLCKESSGRHAEKGEQLRAWAERKVDEQEQAKKRAEMALERTEAIKTAKAHMYRYKTSPDEAYKGFMQEWLTALEAKGEKPDWSKGDYAVSCRMLSSGEYSPVEVAQAIEDHSPDIPARKGEHAADYARRTVEAAERNPKVQEARVKAAERHQSRGPSMGR